MATDVIMYIPKSILASHLIMVDQTTDISNIEKVDFTNKRKILEFSRHVAIIFLLLLPTVLCVLLKISFKGVITSKKTPRQDQS